MSDSQRKYDVVLFGATGFTGGLVAEYLAKRHAAVRWALAGRTLSKLEKVRTGLAAVDPALASLPLLVADSSNAASLEELSRSTKVVATTVGPFRQVGAPLVEACARAGTHYCDLTGEPHFVRDMIDRHHETARKTGAKIVHACGFDSIPSDLGVQMLQGHAVKKFGRPLQRIRFLTRKLSGGVSGGTIASMLLLAEEMTRDKNLRRQVANPYLLVPEHEGRGPDVNDQQSVKFVKDLNQWTAPFVMAGMNTRVVRRTNALLGYPYGKDFLYSEAMGFAPGAAGLARASSVAALLGGVLVSAVTPPGRSLLRMVLPKQGEGPSKKARDEGHFTIKLFGDGVDANGAPVKLNGVVKGISDPGYGETAKMLAESALCLATDDLPGAGGVLTPAAAMGLTLVDRLRAAGMTFEVEA